MLSNVNFKTNNIARQFNYTIDYTHKSESYWLLHSTGVQLEANVFKFMKVYAGVNYRLAWKDAIPNQLGNSTVEGLSANAGIKIGVFEV